MDDVLTEEERDKLLQALYKGEIVDKQEQELRQRVFDAVRVLREYREKKKELFMCPFCGENVNKNELNVKRNIISFECDACGKGYKWFGESYVLSQREIDKVRDGLGYTE